MKALLLIPALAGCGLLGINDTNTEVEVGTVHVVAFDRAGAPAGRAEVVVHDANGVVFARATLAADGTGDVDSVAGGTVTVAIRTETAGSSLTKESGELTTFFAVPLDVTLHVGAANPAREGATFDVSIQVPEKLGSPFYEVSVGCENEGFSGPIQDETLFLVHVPVDCGTSARTIIATAFQDFSPVAVSVLRGVDLHQGGTIEMPAYEPLRTVSLDITGHDPDISIYDGSITLFNDGGRYPFFGEVDRETGRCFPEVATGDWQLTRYERQLVFNDRDDLTFSVHEQVDAGAPTSTAIPDADFLVPPVRAPGELNFSFEGDIDYRMLDLRYRCFKCDARGRWTLFAPPSDEPIVLPEMPADLRPLTPRGAALTTIAGHIFEASELAGYEAFLNAAPGLVPGSVHREGIVVLLAEGD